MIDHAQFTLYVNIVQLRLILSRQEVMNGLTRLVRARPICAVARHLATSATTLKTIKEPEYLDEGGPQPGTYGLVNICAKGMDYTVLEHYAKWVHNTAIAMDIEVTESWATPAKKMNVQVFKSQSNKVLHQHHLNVYQRNVQVIGMTSVETPVFLRVITAGLPEGVELCVQDHLPEHFEDRYIPDLQLKELRKQLDALGGPSTTAKRGR
ncbi:mitochondrial ribosomal protein L48 [Oratosquilla oratoria]|uniref:mitochondrial ribosomal protein L48 n=1 Tax=Oratosquilla oratoria TaxID=337810 RepID=UPI003F75EDA7